MTNQIVAGVYARTILNEMIASGETFRGILLDAKVPTGSGTPNTTATGNIYVQEIAGTNPTNGLPQYSFASGFTNTNATKRGACFRTSNPTNNVIEVRFDDNNIPASSPIVVTLQPGDHYIFISRTVSVTAHQSSWRVAGSGATFVNAGAPKPPNANVFNWDGTVTLPSPLVSVVQTMAGLPLTVGMSVSKVMEISKVTADPVFSDEANWHLVAFIYKKQGSSQRLVSTFRDFDAEKQMKLKAGMMTGDVFELHKIIISKADRTLMVVKRSEVENASSYDFTLA